MQRIAELTYHKGCGELSKMWWELPLAQVGEGCRRRIKRARGASYTRWRLHILAHTHPYEHTHTLLLWTPRRIELDQILRLTKLL